MSLIPISSFSDEIIIIPRESHNNKYINQPITIRAFLGPNVKGRLFKDTETNELFLERITLNAPMKYIKGLMFLELT